MSRLMWGLEEAVAERRHVSSPAEAKALDAAQFAALYGSSHLSTLFEPCRASSGPLAGAVAAVNDDVQWLVLQLEDFVEVLKGERGP
jgi:hypothetical protein